MENSSGASNICLELMRPGTLWKDQAMMNVPDVCYMRDCCEKMTAMWKKSFGHTVYKHLKTTNITGLPSIKLCYPNVCKHFVSHTVVDIWLGAAKAQ